ncbi:MAG: AIR synthase-related protein [Euryarchaeota archaeon]|nr:AIR synthase-related protein [Euryarchaeota archaeon]
MVDLEGLTRKKLKDGFSDEQILKLLAETIRDYKKISPEKANFFAKAVFDEIKTTLKTQSITDHFLKELIEYPKANISMGEIGVGSRGEGDFFIHKKIAEIVKETKSTVVGPRAQDDAGVVRADPYYIAVTVDGTHSRLSEYPFLAGFHVARAALRDIYVMGGNPIAMLTDLHLADDGDVGKLFDFTAGVCTISELTDIPLAAGSTLRVGGDLVLGDRMVSCVGAVGVINGRPTARKNAEPKDVILMTEGAGGGTITTTAIYNGYFDVVKETLNINFIQACQALLQANLLNQIHAMADVTNGGLRGDAWEISRSANVKLTFNEKAIKSVVNKKVLKMLESLKIDYLGVSLDALLLIAPKSIADYVKTIIERTGIKVAEIGNVEKGPAGAILFSQNTKKELTPLFREAAYTKIKKAIGEKKPPNFEKMKKNVEKALRVALEKKDNTIAWIKAHNAEKFKG